MSAGTGFTQAAGHVRRWARGLPAGRIEGGTRWRRAALIALPPVLVVGALGAAMAQGVMAVGFTVQNGNAQMTTKGLYGVDSAIAVSTITRSNGTVQRITRFAFAQGLINELCMSQSVLGGLATLKLTAGDGDPTTWETRATNVLIDLSTIQADMALDGAVNMGQDGPTVSAGDNDMGSSSGFFGIDAGFADVRRVKATIADMQVPGVFKAPGLKIAVGVGSANTPCLSSGVPTAPTGNPPAAGSITGTVTQAGVGVSGATVAVYEGDQLLSSTKTATNGTYKVYMVPGTYTVQFSKSGLTTQWFNGKPSQSTATPVTVGAGATVAAINAAM